MRAPCDTGLAVATLIVPALATLDDVRQQLGAAGRGAGFGEGDGRGDLALEFGPERLGQLGIDDERIAALPGIDAVFRPIVEVEILADADMFLVTRGDDLQYERLAGPHACRCLERRLPNGQRVPAFLDPPARDAERSGVLGQAVGLADRTMAVDGEAIVFAEEQHRYLHERSEIQAFVIDALFGRAIAEDCHRETIDTA